MKRKEFVDVLIKYPGCLEDEKKFRGILYDMFPTDEGINNVLVSLFKINILTEIESAESLDTPLYHKFKKTVVNKFAIDEQMADQAVRLWMYGYGRDILGREVEIGSSTPPVNTAPSSTQDETQTLTSFSGCPFKITVPDVHVVDGAVNIGFDILTKVGSRVDVVVDSAHLTDKLGRDYDYYVYHAYKPGGPAKKAISVEIPINGKQFLLSDSTIVLGFICNDGKYYEVTYTSKRDTGIRIKDISVRLITQEENDRFEDAMLEYWDPDEPEAGGEEAGPDEDGDENNDTITIPQIEEYKKAVLREKYYLQQEGGRKYKLSNGQRLASHNGLSTYSFEMEAELNLSDDAPITLHVGADDATGSVLICEGFQIIVVIDKDYGASIGRAMMSVEPWKLLEAIVNKLDGLSVSHDIALKLIEDGPGLATTEQADKIPQGQDKALKTVENNDITVIWGPPGTGKTYTMAQIAKEGLKQGKSVLVVSHSNVSVDGVVKQTVASLKNAGMDDLLTNGRVLRYGFVRDEDLSKDTYAVAYNYALNHRPDLQRQIETLNKEKEKLKQTGGALSGRRADIEKELKKLRAEVRSEEKHYVERADFVATTISKVTVDSLFEDAEYDIVMFDEVSMAYVPQIVCAAMCATEKLILVGDFRQLAPIVQSEAKAVLSVDIFSYLGMVKSRDVYAHPWLVMLNEQRRMHPDISAFPNKHIYKNLLKDYDGIANNRADIVSREPLPGNAANLINLAGTYCAAMKNSDNSRFNILSAVIAFSTAIQAEENGETSIGIITPYAAQTRLIRAMIQDYRKSDTTNVACSTVHQFQGSERDLIIFDAVESYPASKVGWLMGKALDSVSRLINVAVTRARGKLIVVANAKFWAMKFDKTPHIFWRLIKHLSENGNTVSTKDKTIGPYIQELPYLRTICNYTYLNEAIDDFRKDVEQAHEKIVISIPDGELDFETQGQILDIIMKAKTNGIHILSKTNGYEDLPEGWKSLTYASENAVFPLIIIDDKVAWYGLPKSRGQFIDGNNGFRTVCQTYYRIVGEHTLEMIKAFSDFENREINGQLKPLLEKDPQKTPPGGGSSSNNDDGKGAAGMDAFIRKVEKCPKCNSPMTLARGKTGKCYLRCSSSSCKETGLLTKEVANWYITHDNVKCPIHHCDIQARVGQYGLYIKCDMGHYLKPDEI